MIQKIKAVTLVELEISVVIAAIMVLIVGVLGTMSIEASNKARHEADIFSDLRYSFEMMQHKIRAAHTLGNVCPAGSACVGDCLVDGNIYFCAKNNLGLIYYNNTENLLFPIKAGDSIALSVPTIVPNSYVIMKLSGTRDYIKFDVSNTIKKRAQ